MKILIVEDEVLLADSLKAALEQKGFTVETPGLHHILNKHENL